MSKSKSSGSNVMTMEQLKQKTRDIILSNDEYEQILDRLQSLNDDLAKMTELNDRKDIKEIYLKQEIEDLVKRVEVYKSRLKNKEELDVANEEIAREMIKNKERADAKLKQRTNNKYTAKSKEELEQEVRNEIELLKNNYKDRL
jgi:hypothetical protein